MGIMSPCAVIFSGQGAQQVGMGKSFYENSDLARSLYDNANSILGWDLKKVCFEGPAEALTETRVCQPALYVHGYVGFKLLEEAGKLEGLKVAFGLSLGELTALAAAEAFDFETGLRLVAERGRLMQQACESSKGAMASIIGGTTDEVKALCDEADVDMANLNCPGQIVISGEEAKIEKAVERGKEMGFKRVIPLKVAGAYHSRLMEPARKAFEKTVNETPFSKPKLTVFTNVTGEEVSETEAIKAALVKQVVSPVHFEGCLRSAAAQGVSNFYECGVGNVLAGLARRTDKEWNVVSVSEWDDVAKQVAL